MLVYKKGMKCKAWWEVIKQVPSHPSTQQPEFKSKASGMHASLVGDIDVSAVKCPKMKTCRGKSDDEHDTKKTLKHIPPDQTFL